MDCTAQGIEALVRRLESHSSLSAHDRALLRGLPLETRAVHDAQTLAWAGERAASATLVLSGWCCSYRLLGDGRRQVVAFHLPGEIPDLSALDMGVVDASLANVGRCTVAAIPHRHLQAARRGSEGLDAALRRECHVQASLAASWLANVGRRSGLERTAHFLCETYDRLRALGLARDGRMRMPATQVDLSDALGLTAVHVNRVIQHLRAKDLVRWARGEVAMPDRDALEALCDYEGSHLHLPDPPARAAPGARRDRGPASLNA